MSDKRELKPWVLGKITECIAIVTNQYQCAEHWIAYLNSEMRRLFEQIQKYPGFWSPEIVHAKNAKTMERIGILTKKKGAATLYLAKLTELRKEVNEVTQNNITDSMVERCINYCDELKVSTDDIPVDIPVDSSGDGSDGSSDVVDPAWERYVFNSIMGGDYGPPLSDEEYQERLQIINETLKRKKK